MFTPSLFVLLASAGLIEARSLFEARHLHGGLLHRRAAAGDATGTTLSPAAIQSGSFFDGSQEIGANEAQQAKSQTSQNNFINNCAGKTLTNGLQIVTGSCNGITMGDIPAKTSMVSSIITFPLPGSATIESDTTFNITVQTSNLVAGSFTNADATYYGAPQFLSGGKIVGHTHVTVQDLGASLNPTAALDATQFAFFKGINDAGNGQGLLSATVTGGLPAGNYRVCTMASASNHQPVLMPVAQRGTSDDCTKFTVIGSGSTINVAANDGSKGIAAAALAASAVAAGPGAIESNATSAASSTSTSAALTDSNSTTTASTSSTTDKGNGKGIKGVSSISKAGKDTTTSLSTSSAAATTAPFSNSTTTTTKKSGNGKGGKDVASSTSVSLASDVASSTSVSLASDTTSASSSTSTGKSSGKSSGGSTVQKVTVIETFFEFILSLGGLPPSVGKNGESFIVIDEVFEDIVSAASAACGHQYESCISFSGPGFSLEECQIQKTSCSNAANTASVTASTAAKITATVTVPATATVTGSVLSTVATISASSTPEAVSAQAETTAAAVEVAPPATTAAAIFTSAAVADVASSSEAGCSIVTSTVVIDPPASTDAAIVSAPFSNSTASATSSASASASASGSTSTSSAGALGGIAAPPVTNSGDATRPFEVNGNTFVNKSAALQRSCDIQFNACANAVNGGTAVGFVIADCSTQETACLAT